MPLDYGVATAGKASSDLPGWGLHRIQLSHRAIAVLVGLCEIGFITIGGTIGQVAYELAGGPAGESFAIAVATGLISGQFYALTGKAAGLYSLPCLVAPAKHFRQIVGVCGLVMLGLTAFLFLFKIGSQFSRGSVFGFSVAMLPLCILTRVGAGALIGRLMSRSAIVGTPAFLIGDADELTPLTPAYLLRQFGLREVGRVTLGEGKAPYRDLLQEALQLARTQKASQFVVATRWSDGDRLAKIEEALRASPLPARLLPSSDHRAMIERYAPSRDATTHLLDLQRAPMGVAERLAKRSLDMCGATCALLVLLPVIVIAAAAIAIDSPGPIIFRQRRNGFDQRHFTILKFRTMRVLEDGPAVVQARREDSRVTRVGRFLRRSSIDELPQLINVLRGDMSLVGPRPHALAHDHEYTQLIDDYCMRHHVKPGITGWAQVNGLRGETIVPAMMKQRVELDLWYIKNWSVLLDLRILVRTCFGVLSQDAY